MSERTIGNYKPLHNLPPLAGVASLAGAAGPGLGVQACVDRLKRFHFASHRLWQILLARLTAEPLYELKMGFSHHAYLAAEHITLLRNRVAEMRHPPLGLDKIPHASLAVFFDELLNAPDVRRLVVGIYRVALPALCESLQEYRADTNPLTDAPTLRIFRTIFPEVEEMIRWGESVCVALEESGAEGGEDLEAWQEELRGWLAAAGGLAGTSEESPAPTPRYSAQEFRYDRTPQRDERFPDPYNMGVHAEEFLYDESFESRDKVFMMFYKRIREIDVPEMMASILYEMVTATGDEEEGGRPWGFYRDMTRQLWDEARHAMMGEVGFARSGIDWPSKVMINFTWSKGLNEQLTPRERHAVLWFIEQGLMSKTGKRYEWEVGSDSGDAYSELIQDFDWADEVLHARIGRDWYVKDFENVAAAAEYGSACWDKVVSDWEQWRKDGLTEHRNWWPDLYREVCKHRGEEPDPRVLAYDQSYADTRADLRRISASG
ncbi:MAG: hypothetical protein VCA73_00740 [Roseibacillus sp.]|jgi:hypothetical protein